MDKICKQCKECVCKSCEQVAWLEPELKQARAEIDDYIKQLDALKPENVELHKIINKLTDENIKLMNNIKSIKKSRKLWEREAMKQGAIKVVEVDKYRTALKNIKHILKIHEKELEECLCNNIDEKILVKINEVLGGEYNG